MHKVSAKIDQLRTERKWTVYRLSEESGISQSAIHKWFDTKATPTIDALEQICEAFRITLAEFFLGENGLVELTGDRKSLFDKWSLLSKSQQVAVLGVINSYLTDAT